MDSVIRKVPLVNKKVPIGGFQKQSLIDYPGHIASILFTCGCNFRCNYCHNPQLFSSDTTGGNNELNEKSVLNWLSENRVLLDAVVITGGEPTLHASLPGLISRIKELNLKVKLDTNGTNPDMLEKLLDEKLVDYFAMDVKAPLILSKYKKVVGAHFNDHLLEKVMHSVNILKQKKVDFEFRTTVDDSLCINDFIAIAGEVSGKYYIQNRVERGKIAGSQMELTDMESIRAGLQSKGPLMICLR
jgi:pyruvate formate lyase activating enzyme